MGCAETGGEGGCYIVSQRGGYSSLDGIPQLITFLVSGHPLSYGKRPSDDGWHVRHSLAMAEQRESPRPVREWKVKWHSMWLFSSKHNFS